MKLLTRFTGFGVFVAVMFIGLLFTGHRSFAMNCEWFLLSSTPPPYFERAFIVNIDAFRYLSQGGRPEDVLMSHLNAAERLNTWVYTHSMEEKISLLDVSKKNGELQWMSLIEILSDPASRYGKTHFFPVWIDPASYDNVAANFPVGLQLSRGKPGSHLLLRLYR